MVKEGTEDDQEHLTLKNDFRCKFNTNYRELKKLTCNREECGEAMRDCKTNRRVAKKKNFPCFTVIFCQFFPCNNFLRKENVEKLLS